VGPHELMHDEQTDPNTPAAVNYLRFGELRSQL
jgi:hypothetical protein